MGSELPGFAAEIDRQLRRRGFAGPHATVVLRSSAVTIAGEGGVSLAVPLGEIACLRVGFLQTRVGLFRQILLWRRGDGRPLRLGTYDPREHRRFAGFVRATASALAAAGRLEAIETGENRFFAGLIVAALSGIAAGLAGGLEFAFTDAEAELGVPRWVAVAVALPLLCASCAFVWWTWSRLWPRRVRALADLDRVLPPPPR